MPARQPSWDKFEAVILLDSFLLTLSGDITRTDAVRAVSQNLRKMATNRGIEIDDTYRNENGISFQMKSMESAYHRQTMFKPASQLFSEIADLYRGSEEEYQKLLKKAKAMINKTASVEDNFMKYLAGKVTPAQLSELYLCYSEIEAFCLKLKVLQSPLFQTTDFEVIKKVQRTIEQNKFFRMTHKKQFNKIVVAGRHYYAFIKEMQSSANALTEPRKDESEATPKCTAEKSVPNTSSKEIIVEVPLARTEQDHRLLQKYPIIYKRLFNTLKDLTQESSSTVGVLELCEKINRIARPSVVEEILDNVSWAQESDEKYQFSNDIVDHHVIIDEPEPVVENPQISNTARTIDFTKSFDLAYTKPEELRYFGDIIEFENSWTALYVSIVAAFIEDYPHIFQTGMSFSKNNGRIELAHDTDFGFMFAPKPIPGTGFMLETNISANDIANKIRFIMDLCNVDYENVVITYSNKTSSRPSPEVKRASDSKATVTVTEANSRNFAQYMRDTLNMADATCRSYASAINNCESFAREHGLSSCRLYGVSNVVAMETARLLLSNAEFLEYNAKQHNRFRAALQKYLTFIGSDLPATVPSKAEAETPYRNEHYEVVLRQNFKKGFRLESPLEIRKFRRYYTAIHGTELSDSDDDISLNIKNLCIEYDGKAFLPEVMLSEDLKNELLQYIEDAFSDGTKALYYQAIYTEFADVFLDYHIHDADMLKAYLTYIGSHRFFINRNFVSKEANVVLDPVSEIRSCLQGHGRPVEYEELFDALPHLPQSNIKFILASNGEFVNNGHGAYFHESIVRLSDEELEGISTIIQQTIDANDFIAGNELYDAIKAKYPYIIEDNHTLTVYGFRDALKAKLGDKFSFKGNIISRAGQELSMADVFAKFAHNRDSFTLSELQGLANNLATVIYFDAVYENSLRISRDQFVSKTAAQFSIAETDEVLDRVCTGKYMPIQGVTNFGIFPYAGYPWNSFLLEHYVANYSQKYMILHSNFNGTECAGAIVKRSAGITSFDDLIVDLLVNNTIEMKKEPVLQFLSDMGYLSRRRYSRIEALIIKANAQRNWKDKD